MCCLNRCLPNSKLLIIFVQDVKYNTWLNESFSEFYYHTLPLWLMKVCKISFYWSNWLWNCETCALKMYGKGIGFYKTILVGTLDITCFNSVFCSSINKVSKFHAFDMRFMQKCDKIYFFSCFAHRKWCPSL